jgi:hypothetical protein
VCRYLSLPRVSTSLYRTRRALGTPNTILMTCGNPRNEWGRNGEEMHVFWRFSRPGYRDTGRPCPFRCFLRLLFSAGKWSIFPCTNSDFGVLWLVELVWTRATTPCSWICILWLRKNSLFSSSKWLSRIAVAPPYCVLFAPLAFP